MKGSQSDEANAVLGDIEVSIEVTGDCMPKLSLLVLLVLGS